MVTKYNIKGLEIRYAELFESVNMLEKTCPIDIDDYIGPIAQRRIHDACISIDAAIVIINNMNNSLGRSTAILSGKF